MAEYSEEFPLSETHVLEFSITFNRDTMSWYTGKPKKKGYEAHFTRKQIWKDENGNRKGTMFTAGDGTYVNVLESERKSKKKLEEAIRNARDLHLNKILEYYRNKEKLMNEKVSSCER
jgi:hypothetical protein